MLGLFQINQEGAGAADTKRIWIHGKALETLHIELPLKTLYCRLIHKGPLVYGCGIIVSKALLKPLFIATLDNQLTGLH